MAAAFAQSRGLAGRSFVLSGQLHADELEGLARAWDVGLIDVDDCGTFRVMGSRTAKGPYNLFSSGPRPALNREYLIQIAAFTELVLDHGWPSVRTAFEHDAHATFGTGGRCVVAGEAKATEALPASMITGMCRMGNEQLQAPATNAERKVAALVRLRAPVFWAVAPGVRWTFDVDYAPDVPALTPRTALPACVATDPCARSAAPRTFPPARSAPAAVPRLRVPVGPRPPATARSRHRLTGRISGTTRAASRSTAPASAPGRRRGSRCRSPAPGRR